MSKFFKYTILYVVLKIRTSDLFIRSRSTKLNVNRTGFHPPTSCTSLFAKSVISCEQQIQHSRIFLVRNVNRQQILKKVFLFLLTLFQKNHSQIKIPKPFTSLPQRRSQKHQSQVKSVKFYFNFLKYSWVRESIKKNLHASQK